VDEHLRQIDRLVLQLFAMVGENVAGATHALLSGDREAAKQLAERDEVVDSLYREIERRTLEQLTVGGHTAPADLRFLVTVIRMLPDLERNGDLAEHVARRAARGLGSELSPRSRGLVERMGEVAIHMWRVTADAYAERNPGGATTVDDLDDEMDDLHVSLTVEVVAGTMPLPVAVELAMVARFYERFGDHAVNVARRASGLAEVHAAI
jgi:phosphate transport system protein